ncbi:MAG: NAD(P)H-hydrate epimerase [Candidatus Aenigmarchaeota archaeon]|nr:NAD(P)H-hydrate epimerase [Candidatus Aenigmarchaeota archaeon]
MDIPRVSVEQMRRIDELATSHFGIEPVQLMEHAGRAVASRAREIAGVRGRTITVLVGKGHNGGDALVAARFLVSWGATVYLIVAAHPDEMKPLVRDHYGTATAMHLNRMTAVDNLQWEQALKESDLLVDGLLGYGATGNPRGIYADLIALANQSRKKILAIDIPSGLDADTGVAGTPCVVAAETLTLGLPKRGLFLADGKKHAGRVAVADIGIPHEVFELMGLQVPRLFEKQGIVRV